MNNKISEEKIKYIHDVAYNQSENLTFHKSKKRKSKEQIFNDLINWYFRFDEFDRNYFVRGSDVEGSNVLEYPLKFIIRLRDEYNKLSNRENHNILLHDKNLFSNLCDYYQIPTQPIIACAMNKQFEWKKYTENELFIKKNDGYGGSVVMVCTYDKNENIFIENDKTYSPAELVQEIDGDFIIQERIIQHELINKLYSKTINTIRVVSTNTHGNVKIHGAQLKFGTKKSKMDTWAAGGIIIKVDLNSGKLAPYGYHKYAKYGENGEGIVYYHPETKVLFKDFEIPFLEEMKELIIKAHLKFNQIHSVGWDVVLTPNGPILLEGNHNWGVILFSVTTWISIN